MPSVSGLVLQPNKQGKSEGFDSCDRPSNLKLDSNRRFLSPCDREIWRVTFKDNRALLLYYVKLCASFRIHWWIQTGVIVQKCSIRVAIDDIFPVWPWNLMGDLRKKIVHLNYTTSSFVHHFKAISEVKLELQSGNAQFGSNSAILVSCELKIWQMTLKNNRAPVLCSCKLCASFHSHWWIQTGVTVRMR